MTGARLTVEGETRLLTVQDRGRQGAMRYGVSASGPMDWVRFSHALSLAGGGGVAAFELSLAGGTFRAEGRVVVGVAGPGFLARIGERPGAFDPPFRATLEDGERLVVQPGRQGMWAYVAVNGIDFGRPVLGSFATNARTGLGARDFLGGFPVAEAAAAERDAPPYEALDISLPTSPIGLLPGPQHHLFEQAVRDAFAATPYRLTDQVDRMGYRLEGTPLKAKTHDIISDGIVEGAIQVPGNGQPIVLCADRAPTGGYPKIAVVASADLPHLTQARPGAELRFAWISLKEAARRRRALVETLRQPSEPRVRDEFPAEFLAGQNLVGGVVSATANATLTDRGEKPAQ